MSGNMKSNHLQVRFSLNLVSLTLILLLVCFQVAVQLEASPDFLTAPVEKEQKSHCICLNERHNVSWVVTPKSLGEPGVPEDQESQWKPCSLSQTKTPPSRRTDFLWLAFQNAKHCQVYWCTPSGQPLEGWDRGNHEFKANQGQSGVQGQSGSFMSSRPVRANHEFKASLSDITNIIKHQPQQKEVFSCKIRVQGTLSSSPLSLVSLASSKCCFHFRSLVFTNLRQTLVNSELGSMEEGEMYSSLLGFFFPARKCEFHCKCRGSQLSEALWEWGTSGPRTWKERHSHQVSVGWSKQTCLSERTHWVTEEWNQLGVWLFLGFQLFNSSISSSNIK